MKRARANSRSDKKRFSWSAKRVNPRNTQRKPMRGGIRL